MYIITLLTILTLQSLIDTYLVIIRYINETKQLLFYPCSADDTYIEVLDSTRIHPETYEWARKMAVDALEYDEAADDANPAEALEEILENPDKLKDLDLDAFAEELERQASLVHASL